MHIDNIDHQWSRNSQTPENTYTNERQTQKGGSAFDTAMPLDAKHSIHVGVSLARYCMMSLIWLLILWPRASLTDALGSSKSSEPPTKRSARWCLGGQHGRHPTAWKPPQQDTTCKASLDTVMIPNINTLFRHCLKTAFQNLWLFLVLNYTVTGFFLLQQTLQPLKDDFAFRKFCLRDGIQLRLVKKVEQGS